VRAQRAQRGSRATDAGMHLTLGLGLVTGVLTGLVVAAFERVVQPLLDALMDGSLVAWVVVPAAGLIIVNLMASRWADGDTATTDAYVRAYHQRAGGLGLRAAVRKLTMSAISLSSGAALGFEGPALLAGGTIGSAIDRRFLGRFRRDDAKVLMVAGAAAGVAAIFKAPLTGVCFALEVPYRADLARRALPAALAAAGSAYVTYVLIVGTEPLFATGGAASFDLTDLAAALLLGVVCGILARTGAWAIAQAKQLPLGRVGRLTLAVAGLTIGALLSNWWFDAPPPRVAAT
jgi:CIC family chloride channel protein